MKCLELRRADRQWDMPLAGFLGTSSLVRRLASQQNMTVEEMLVDGLIANRLEHETFESWLARQVREVLTLSSADGWRALPGSHMGVRTGRGLENLSFSGADRAWLVETLGQRADVQAVWREACGQRAIALAA